MREHTPLSSPEGVCPAPPSDKRTVLADAPPKWGWERRYIAGIEAQRTAPPAGETPALPAGVSEVLAGSCRRSMRNGLLALDHAAGNVFEIDIGQIVDFLLVHWFSPQLSRASRIDASSFEIVLTGFSTVVHTMAILRSRRTLVSLDQFTTSDIFEIDFGQLVDMVRVHRSSPWYFEVRGVLPFASTAFFSRSTRNAQIDFLRRNRESEGHLTPAG